MVRAVLDETLAAMARAHLASARRDGGAGQTGSGLEVAGGFRTAGGPVRIDARGRFLVLHSAEGYEERGLGVTLSAGSPSDEEGLSLSVITALGRPRGHLRCAVGRAARRARPAGPAARTGRGRSTRAAATPCACRAAASSPGPGGSAAPRAAGA